MDLRSLRKRLGFLRFLPLHPQWLISKEGDRRVRYVGALKGSIIDIGCSDKAISIRLPEGCSYFGLDYYSTTKAFYGTRPDMYGDACQLPLVGGCADGVLLFEVLEHVPDPERAVAEAARVLRPGGTLLLSVPFMYPIHNAPFDFHRFTRHALERLLHRHGFTIDVIQTRLRPMEVAGLNTALALGDSANCILERHPWAILFVLPLAVLVLLCNLMTLALSRILPGSEFMPGGYEVVATRNS